MRKNRTLVDDHASLRGMKTSTTPILIVGAGPTGLVLALWLRRAGVPFRLIDRANAPGTTSRAIAIQARTLEFYRQLGIDREIVAAGKAARALFFRRKGHVVATARFGDLGAGVSPFPYLVFLGQDAHEKILNERLRALDVEIERGSELLAVQPEGPGAVARIRRADGTEEEIHAQYLCGCDGAHSPVRHAIAEFPGGAYSQVFYVADVQASGEQLDLGLQVSVSRDDFCILMPMKNALRLIGIVPPELEGRAEITFEDLRPTVRANSGLEVSRVEWFSVYRIHHRVATRFRDGGIFLAGDAGHIHSPAGGQGMNTGIGDAVNLGWKLAAVLRGEAAPQILDTYESERRAFAQVLVRSTDRAFKLIASRNYLGSLVRAYVIPRLFAALTRWKFFLNLMFRTVSQIRIHYRQSLLSEGTVNAGDRLPYLTFARGDNYEPLATRSWQLHVYGRLSDGLQAFARKRNLPVYQLERNEDAGRKGLARDGMYLVRPDGYLGLADDRQDLAHLQGYLNKWSLRF